jgi:hypothetical protein
MNKSELFEVLKNYNDLPIYVTVGYNRYEVGNQITLYKDYISLDLFTEDVDNPVQLDPVNDQGDDLIA